MLTAIRATAAVSLLVTAFLAHGQSVQAKDMRINDVPPIRNLVPDAETAIAIATAVLIPIYGERQVKFESPFTASLEGSTWLVVGHVPEGWLGSAAAVELSKENGRIIRILHVR